MRISHYQSGETLRPRIAVAASESYGRIAAQRPAIPARTRVPVVLAQPETTPAPDFRRLEAAAHAAQARLIGDFAIAAWRGVAATARRVAGAWLRQRQRRATYVALSDLDDRTLQDLGLGRGEILSVAMDAERDDDNRRLRAARAANGLQLF